MPPNHFESEVESFLEGSHGDRTHIKRADHHTVTPLCGTLLRALSGHSQKTSPSAPQNAYFVPFLVGWANYFARRTQPRGDFETSGTSAAADAGQRETAITTAHPSTATVETDNTSATEKHAKNTHFSPAKAMTVSTCPRHRPAKATRVSTRRK